MYRIPEENISKLEELIGKLARRAKRLGVTPISIRRVGIDVVKGYDENPLRLVLVEVEGEAPVLQGWRFLATIDHTHDAGNIVRTVPGAEIPASYRDADPTCDHCQVNRRRNDTFVLRHEERGNLMQVGRSCLSSFLGGIDPKAAAEMAEMLAVVATTAEDCEEYDPRFGGGGGGALTYWTSLVLGVAAQFVIDNGWVSGKAASLEGTTSTADLVRAWIVRPNPKFISPAADALAEKALAWVEEEVRPKEVKSDYEHNLVTVLTPSAIRWKEIGIAVSAIGVFQQAQARKAQAASAVNEYVGNPGDKLSGLELTLLATRHINGTYGASTLMMFRDAAGRGFKWFASNPPEMREGETYTVAATVKKHEEFKGRKETVLTRCVVR